MSLQIEISDQGEREETQKKGKFFRRRHYSIFISLCLLADFYSSLSLLFSLNLSQNITMRWKKKNIIADIQA